MAEKRLRILAVKYIVKFLKLFGRKMLQPMVQISKSERKEAGGIDTHTKKNC